MTKHNVISKRIFSIILTIAVALSMMPTMAWADESGGLSAQSGNVAVVDGKEYPTWDEAFKALDDSYGGNVKLLDDVTLDGGKAIAISYGTVLDLNGKTVRQQTLEGVSGAYCSVFYVQDGKLTITDSQGDGSIEQPNACPAVTVYRGIANINGGTIKTTTPGGDGAVYINGGTATINGGKIEGIESGVHIYSGNLTVNGGSIYGRTSNALRVDGGNVKLSGGTYSTDEKDGHSIWNNNDTAVSLLAAADLAYMTDAGEESTISEDSKGVVGKTTVTKAPDRVAYIGEGGSEQSRTDCTELTGETTVSLSNGWYVVKGNMEVETLDITGEDVSLILGDGATLTVKKQITASIMNASPSQNMLKIYLQSGGTGKLIAENGINVKRVSHSCIGTVVKRVGNDGEPSTDFSYYFELSKCDHPKVNYTSNDETYHAGPCVYCNTLMSGKHTFDGGVSENDESHKVTCTACGYEKTEAHEIRYTINADGLTHKRFCWKCELTPVDLAHRIENGKCVDCGAEETAKIDTTVYTSLAGAFAAAKDSDTITLLRYVMLTEPLTVEVNSSYANLFTLDLNGNTIVGSDADIYDNVLFVDAGVDLTICDSSTAKSGKIAKVKDKQTYAVYARGMLTVTGGSFDDVYSSTSADISGGTFSRIGTSRSAISDVLAKGYAFANSETNTIVNGYNTNCLSNVTVVEHATHNFTNDGSGNYVCDCGYTCEHPAFENGVCSTCGYTCPHTEVNETTAKCSTCGTTFVVKVTNGETTSYSADLAEALNTAETGTTIHLLTDVELEKKPIIRGDDKIVILNLNEHSISANSWRGYFSIGTENASDTTRTSATLKIIGNGNVHSRINIYGGTLDLSDWKGSEIDAVAVSIKDDKEDSSLIVGKEAGHIGRLELSTRNISDISKTTLSGGSYGEIWRDGVGTSVMLGNMLANGFAFKNSDKSFVKYTDTLALSGSLKEVTVVKCPHGGEAASDTDGTYRCAYCNTVVTASVSDGETPAYYATLQDALNSAETGDTVTLLTTSNENYEIKKAITLDLKGNNIGEVTCSAVGVKITDSAENKGTITKLTVSSGMLKDLLTEGYGFQKADSNWASETELNEKSIENVAVKQTPIKSLRVTPAKTTITYGYETAPTLQANVTFAEPESATPPSVIYQWYQVVENQAVKIDNATAETYQLDTDLDAGTYTFYCAATADSYTADSENVSVTVEKAAPTYTKVPTATAVSYNGTARPLITAGTATGGEVQYSRTQDGAYTTEIPKAINAGTYTVWYKIVGDPNHGDSEAESLSVTIKPMLIMAKLVETKKKYDGNTTANLQIGEFKKQSDDSEIILNDTQYSLTGKYDSAAVGENKNVTYTIELKDRNYAFETSNGGTTNIFEGETYGIITKADAPTLGTMLVELKVGETGANSVYIRDVQGIPADASGRAYAKGTMDPIQYVDEWSVDSSEGKVTFKISGANAGTEITLPITISSTNYADATAKVVIRIVKAVPTGAPKYNKISASGKTLADAKLTTEGGTFSVPGTVSWKLDDITKVEQEIAYEWIFTPTDSTNYETITGTIVLWAKASSGGGGGGSVTTPSSEVKTDDKTSQTGEKEKVTTSPTEVKNETKTDASGNQVTTATVTVSEANQKEILKQAKDNKSSEILIKVSKDSVKEGAKLELNLEKSFIEDILNKTDADLTIQTPDGEKTFTQEELKKLVESTSGNTVTLDPTASTNPTDPADPTSPSTDKNAKLIKGIQNTTIILKSKLLKSGKIRLTWTKSKGYKVDRFEIYRSVKKNSGYGKKAFFTTKSGSAAKYLNTKSLKKGKTYYYKLRGVRAIGGKKYYTQWSNKTWKTVK